MIYLMRDFPHAKLYKTGGSEQAKQIESAPVPLPAPPITTNNAASLAAEHDYAMRQAQMKSVKSSIIAGNTGGYKPKPPSGPTSPAGPSL